MPWGVVWLARTSPNVLEFRDREIARGIDPARLVYLIGRIGAVPDDVDDFAFASQVSQAEAKKFIDSYFARYSSIRKFMDGVVADAKRLGYAETILHRRRSIPDLNSKNASKRAQGQRMAINMVIQGSAADLIKAAMINIQRKIEDENLPVKLILQIHDELVFELPTLQAERHAKWIAKEMTEAIKFDVSLKVDINYGPSWLSDK